MSGMEPEMIMARDALFRPITIGSLNLPNRIIMAPMGQGHAPGGVPDREYPAYYRRRIEGGAGLIMTGATAIPHPAAPFDSMGPHLFGDAALTAWRAVVAEIHAAGGRIIPQLWHAGLQGLALEAPTWPTQGPSGVWLPTPNADGSAGDMRTDGAAMTEREIEAVIDAFADGVETAQTLGFDGVELHGAHGFLIDQFFWSTTNLRTDRYGGSLRERTRFAVEILAECRRRVGPDFPIFFRISQFKMTDYTARLAETPAELAEFLEPLADAGVDVFDCSQRRFWKPEFPGSDLNFAGWTRKLTGKPTIGNGSVGLDLSAVEFGTAGIYQTTATPSAQQLDLLCGMLDRGDFDMVAVGRSILGDAAWAAKLQRGAEAELTPFTAELMMTLC